MREKKSHDAITYSFPTASPKPTNFQRENREARITPLSNEQLKGKN